MSEKDPNSSTPLADDTLLGRAAADLAAWEADELARFLGRQPEQKDDYLTKAQRPVRRVYTPADLENTDWGDIGLPGRYPLHPWAVPDDVPGAYVDDAPDRRLRPGRRRPTAASST